MRGKLALVCYASVCLLLEGRMFTTFSTEVHWCFPRGTSKINSNLRPPPCMKGHPSAWSRRGLNKVPLAISRPLWRTPTRHDLLLSQLRWPRTVREGKELALWRPHTPHIRHRRAKQDLSVVMPTRKQSSFNGIMMKAPCGRRHHWLPFKTRTRPNWAGRSGRILFGFFRY